MGLTPHDVGRLTLGQFAALVSGWKTLHATEDDKARMSDAEAASIFDWMTSSAYQDSADGQ